MLRKAQSSPAKPSIPPHHSLAHKHEKLLEPNPMVSYLYYVSRVVLSIGFALTLMSCGNPCLDVAKQICRCKPTEYEQRQCVRSVTAEADANDSPTPEENEQCSELLATTCTGDDICERLDNGEISACGLTEPR